MEWLWRGSRLFLQRQEPELPASSVAVEPAPPARTGPDPARVAGPVACASILSSDREECLAATATETTPDVRPVKPRKKPVKVSKKKKSRAKVAKAKPKPKAKPKTETAQAVSKAPKKKLWSAFPPSLPW